jgi:hypothetical protein
MTKLQTVTVGAGGSATVTFSNIPQNYTDLKVVVSGRNSVNSTAMGLNFNGNTSGYSFRRLWGDGSSANSGQGSSLTIMEGIIGLPQNNYTASTFGNVEIYILNYTSSNNKSVSVDAVTETNATTSYQEIYAGLWSNPAAITSILFTPADSGSFVQYSTFTLYGIKNAAKTAGNSIKATGGDIQFDGTYVYHVFDATGAFVSTQPLIADVVSVGGGGGGGWNNAGGGGGGEVDIVNNL